MFKQTPERPWGWMVLGILGILGGGVVLHELRLLRLSYQALAEAPRQQGVPAPEKPAKEPESLATFEGIARRDLFQPLPLPRRASPPQASPLRASPPRARAPRKAWSSSFPLPPALFQPLGQNSDQRPEAPPEGRREDFPGGTLSPENSSTSPAEDPPVAITGMVQTGRGVRVLIENLESGRGEVVPPEGEAFGYRVSQVDERKGTAVLERKGQVKQLKLGENKPRKKTVPVSPPPSRQGETRPGSGPTSPSPTPGVNPMAEQKVVEEQKSRENRP